MNKVSLSLCVLLIAVSSSAVADNIYIFGGLGPTSWDSNSNYSYENSVAYHLGVGKDVSGPVNYFMEAAYVDYGLASYSRREGFGGGTYLDTEVEAFAVRLGATINLTGQFYGGGRLGVENWRGESRLTIVPSALSGANTLYETSRDNGTDLSYGIIFYYKLQSGSSWRFDYGILKAETGKDSVKIKSSQVTFVKSFQ